MLAGPKAPVPKFGQPVAPNLSIHHLCPNCRSDPPNIIEEYSKGDLVCGDCGTILGDRIVDTRSEWRTFAGDENGDDPSRVGDVGNPLLDNHFETRISGQDGRSGISRDLKRAAARLSAIDGGKDPRARLVAAFQEIEALCNGQQLVNTITKRAQEYYKMVLEKNNVRGKKESTVLAACITLATRHGGSDRTIIEMGKAFGVKKKELGQMIYAVKAALGPENAVGSSTTIKETTEGLIDRVCNQLGLPREVINSAKYVLSIAESKEKIYGRSPLTIGGAVLFFTCTLFGDNTTASQIAKHAGVSESVVRLLGKTLSRYLDQIIRPEWKTQHARGYAALAATRAQVLVDDSRKAEKAAAVSGESNGAQALGKSEFPS